MVWPEFERSAGLPSRLPCHSPKSAPSSIQFFRSSTSAGVRGSALSFGGMKSSSSDGRVTRSNMALSPDLPATRTAPFSLPAWIAHAASKRNPDLGFTVLPSFSKGALWHCTHFFSRKGRISFSKFTAAPAGRAKAMGVRIRARDFKRMTGACGFPMRCATGILGFGKAQ